MKGLFYCQHLVGVGHLTRSLKVCQSLLELCPIDFLRGGPDIGLSIDSPNFRTIELPPLSKNDPWAPIQGEESMPLRKEILKKELNEPYDFFITELFPFSKWLLKDEVEGIIQRVKELNPRCVIGCSLRDSFLQNDPEQEALILDFINRCYDVVFVHSDPSIFKLEESFSLAKQVKKKVIYTGFITSARLRDTQLKRILVSMGAGSFGGEMVWSAAHTAIFFPQYEYLLVMGPKSPAKLMTELEELFKQSKFNNVRVVPFMRNFEETLAESCLSISLGGYTLIEAVNARTASIVYPSTFPDQFVRSKKFAAAGLARLISEEDLNPFKLKEIIQEVLNNPRPEHEINMSGAKNTKLELSKLLG